MGAILSTKRNLNIKSTLEAAVVKEGTIRFYETRR
jgi:hypothetical protein